jgi:hypothetical protein
VSGLQSHEFKTSLERIALDNIKRQIEMQKAVNVTKKSKTESSPSNVLEYSKADEQTRVFDIMYVRNDEDQSVEVVESPVIDFNEIIEHLREGNSVFIAPKIYDCPAKSRRSQLSHKYIDHI